MTILGKVLAFLNILGVTTFLVLASMDLARKESWREANYRHDLLSYGLPLNDKLLTDKEQPQAELVGDPKQPNQRLKDLFPQNPVNTQVMEVQRVQQVFEGELQKVADNKARHVVLFCQYLLPLATHFEEREELILIRANLATEEKAKALKTALQQAFKLGLNAMKKTEERAQEVGGPEGDKLKRPFEQHYLEAVQGGLDKRPFEGGPDKRPIVKLFLGILPTGGGKTFAEAASKFDETSFLRDVRNDQAKTFEELFDSVYDDLLRSLYDKLKARFYEHFEAARDGKVIDRSKPAQGPASPSLRVQTSPDDQKKAVARLLFNLVEVAPRASNQPRPARIWEDPDYKRVINVVGLETLGQEIEQQARLYQDMINEVTADIKREHENFALVHRDLVEQLKDRAGRIGYLDALLKRNIDAVEAAKDVVKRRQVDVDYYVAELDKVRKETADRLADLTRLETQLFKIRLEVRDATRLNQEYQRQLNQMEERVR